MRADDFWEWWMSILVEVKSTWQLCLRQWKESKEQSNSTYSSSFPTEVHIAANKSWKQCPSIWACVAPNGMLRFWNYFEVLGFIPNITYILHSVLYCTLLPVFYNIKVPHTHCSKSERGQCPGSLAEFVRCPRACFLVLQRTNLGVAGGAGDLCGRSVD